MGTKFNPYAPLTVTDARRHIFEIVNFVSENEGELFRIVGRDASVVVVSAHAWQSLQESIYVFADPVNSKAIHDSIRAYVNGDPGLKMNPLSLSPDDNPFFGMGW